jgi:hypothetical protein
MQVETPGPDEEEEGTGTEEGGQEGGGDGGDGEEGEEEGA